MMQPLYDYEQRYDFEEEPSSFTALFAFIKRNRRFLFCLFVSFFVLAICSKSSFLYPFNDWVDANCYFTVGKGMMHGKVVYRDFFEQKGLYLYLIHGFAYLISNTTFLGVYFFEVIAGALYLYYAAKIIELYLPGGFSYVLLPVLAVLTYTSASFAEGDSAEEFCLPLLMAGLYYFLKFFSGDDLSKNTLIVCGILAGGVLWIKYTMLGFWFAWMICVFIGLLLRKQVKRAFMYCLYFLMGMAFATLPCFLYFALNGALYDWLHTYFTVNITIYGKVQTTLLGVLKTTAASFSDSLSKNTVMVGAGAVLIIGFLFTNKLQRGIWPKLSLMLIFSFLVLGVYGGGKKYPYYFFIFYVFLVLALVAAAKFILFIAKKIKTSSASSEAVRRMLIISTIFICMFSATGAYLYSPNKDFMAIDQSQLAQFRFAEIINRSKHRTLLNYGFLDGGFYTVSGIQPITKYFCKNNVPEPAMMEAQNKIIQNKGVEFVVVRLAANEKKPSNAYLMDNYKLVESVKQVFENKHYTYLLYQAK